jgi:hypothetical protein
MFAFVLLFLIAFSSGVAAQSARTAKSPAARNATLVIAVLMALIHFGYGVGKDLARADNVTCRPAASAK